MPTRNLPQTSQTIVSRAGALLVGAARSRSRQNAELIGALS